VWHTLKALLFQDSDLKLCKFWTLEIKLI
jgi:hypothetical protein